MFKLEIHDNLYSIVFVEKVCILYSMGTHNKDKIECDKNSETLTVRNIFFGKKIGIEEWKLQFLLIKKFNAIKSGIFSHFKNEEDVLKAKEWIESLYVAKKLNKNEIKLLKR